MDMNSEVIEKASALMDSGALQVCFNGGFVFFGATEHRSGLRKLTLQNLNSFFRDNMSDDTVRANWIEPSELLATLQNLAEIDQATNRQMAQESGNFFTTSMDFVKHHLKLGKYQWDDQGLIYTEQYGERTTVPLSAVIAHIKLAMSDYNFHQGRGTKLSKEDIPSCITILETKAAKKRELAVKDKIRYTGSMSEDKLFKTVGDLLEIYFIKRSHENILAFCHMLWQIKRKVFILPVQEELIYSFYSKAQHLGKTHFIKSLAKPFPWGYNGKCKVGDLLKSNELKAQIRGNYLIDIQEMAIGGTTDTSNLDIANTMKTLVGDGSCTVAGRVLYTDSNGVEVQSAVFTTSTNVHIAEVVCDPTGMRRYWEFELNPPSDFDPVFYLKANAYLENIEMLYQAIDENNPYGYYHPMHETHGKYYRSMFKIQSEMGKRDALTTWMDKKGIEVLDEPEAGFTKKSLKSFVTNFNRYMTRVENVEKPFKTFYVTNILHKIHNVEPFVDSENGREGKYLYVREGDNDD